MAPPLHLIRFGMAPPLHRYLKYDGTYLDSKYDGTYLDSKYDGTLCGFGAMKVTAV